MNELELQKQIKQELRRLGHGCWQVDSGKKLTYKTRGQGLEKGFPDLFGARSMDGKLFFVEVKIGKGKPSEDQIKFLNAADENGVLNGVAWSLEQALEIVEGRRTIKDLEENK
ncbi:VRR-NUC domain-containing protein [Enterococcus avium]|uniref:VRR-NUC domain-containing protein n=1 Tax=Enterococcus avium TaxID=33945 RepID=UPI003462DA27